MNPAAMEKAYALARVRYAELGVDVKAALNTLETVSLSLPCWQGDDIRGFEKAGVTAPSGGIQVTGNYPGRARTVAELRLDLKQAFSLIPGSHRLNLHAIYGEFCGKGVDRDEIEPAHFKNWAAWAKQEKLKLDFNATCFAHPKADSGYTLSSLDKEVRTFWVEHVKRCREITAFFGREFEAPCLHNLWIPDGSKDIPFDRSTPRTLLKESLDEIFKREYPSSLMKDSLESKLFGIGSEAYVVGSLEFYLGYALAKRKMICLDLGHFHPTESIADKIPALLPFFEEILLHLSRPLRWDSDHVVILDDELRSVAEEVVRSRALPRVHLALDFFDASINRVGAWVIGARATLKAFLLAMLQPEVKLRELENNRAYFGRLALLEDLKTFPFGAVWDHFCLSHDVPVDVQWPKEVEAYEKTVLSKRGR
jgi:L-rhamnose isomerase